MSHRDNDIGSSSFNSSYDESITPGCFSCFFCGRNRRRSRNNTSKPPTPIPSAFNNLGLVRNNSNIKSNNTSEDGMKREPINYRETRHNGPVEAGGIVYKFSIDTVASYRSFDEPCVIHFVENSASYDNLELEDEIYANEPIGFKCIDDNNYLACILQALFSCRKFIRDILDYGIHIEDERSSKIYFSKKIRDVFQAMQEKKKNEIQRYLTLIQNGLNCYPYNRNLISCFLAIFYKIENETITSEENYSCIKDESIVEPTNEMERFFIDNFYCRIAKTITCDICGEYYSRSVQYLRLIPLTIKNSEGPLELSELIHGYFEEKEISSEHNFKCSNDCYSQTFTKKVTLVRGSEYLIICLKSESEQAFTKEKLFYEKELYITVNKESMKYSLITVIDKINGESKCICKCYYEDNHENNHTHHSYQVSDRKWWIISDERVASVSESVIPFQIFTDNSIGFIFKKS